MKLPTWMRVKRTRRTAPRTVTFDLTIDTSGFVRGMNEAADAMTEMGSVILYRRRIAAERATGRAFVRSEAARVRQELGLR